MATVQFDDQDIPYIDLGSNDNVPRAVVMLSENGINLHIFNILGSDASTGMYAAGFTPSISGKYTVLIYTQDNLLNEPNFDHYTLTHASEVHNNTRDAGEVSFKPDSQLSEHERKYCSCLLKVGAKGGAYNKYAVCAHSTGTTSRNCAANYDLSRMPEIYKQEYLRHEAEKAAKYAQMK